MRCANCSVELIGAYCHQCGQPAHAGELNLGAMLRRFADELVHVDFKSARSIAALFRPGWLAHEFLAGRRQRFLSPLKLYFVAAAVFFFAAPYSGFSMQVMLRQDTTGELKQVVDRRIQDRAISPELFAERFDLRLQTVYTLALGVSVIASALLLQLLFRHQPLGAHLVFALYYVAFIYLAALVVGGANYVLGTSALWTTASSYAVIGPYLFVALRRVYGGSAAATIAKVTVFCLGTLIVDLAVNFAALALTLWLV